MRGVDVTLNNISVIFFHYLSIITTYNGICQGYAVHVVKISCKCLQLASYMYYEEVHYHPGKQNEKILCKDI